MGAMLNRRGFIASVAGAFVSDPERLLWVPGKKMISIPARSAVVSIQGSIEAYFVDCFEARAEEMRRFLRDSTKMKAICQSTGVVLLPLSTEGFMI
jgi:hypothetical protein